jgi:hypothetical protein
VVTYIRRRRLALGAHYIELRYEDLCTRRGEVLQRLLRDIGVSADEHIVKDITPQQLTCRNRKIDPSSLERAKILQEAAPLLEELGYS